MEGEQLKGEQFGIGKKKKKHTPLVCIYVNLFLKENCLSLSKKKMSTARARLVELVLEADAVLDAMALKSVTGPFLQNQDDEPFMLPLMENEDDEPFILPLIQNEEDEPFLQSIVGDPFLQNQEDVPFISEPAAPKTPTSQDTTALARKIVELQKQLNDERALRRRLQWQLSVMDSERHRPPPDTPPPHLPADPQTSPGGVPYVPANT